MGAAGPRQRSHLYRECTLVCRRATRGRVRKARVTIRDPGSHFGECDRVSSGMRTSTKLAMALAILSPALLAQWPAFPAARAPRTPEGQPILTAPAPRTADGRPDLSGVWDRG